MLQIEQRRSGGVYCPHCNTLLALPTAENELRHFGIYLLRLFPVLTSILLISYYKNELEKFHQHLDALLITMVLVVGWRYLFPQPVTTVELSPAAIAELNAAEKMAKERDAEISNNQRKYRHNERLRRKNKHWWQFWI